MNPRTILAYCQPTPARWLKLLEQLVNTDSGSYDPAGLETMIRLMKTQWETLGFVTEVVSANAGSHLVAKRFSKHAQAPTLLLLGHLDTVFDRGAAAKRPFTVKGNRAHGPGVADMKGGLVLMLGVMEALKAHGLLDAAHWLIVHNSDEEIGSNSSKPTIEALARQANAALVFEPGRPDGSIVTARKGGQAYVLEVRGKAAHAGVNPQDGASAIETLCRKVVQLHQLTDHEAGLTVNVGVIQGGSRSNVIADHARAEVDVRTPTPELAQKAKDAIYKICEQPEVPGTTIQVTLRGERPPMVPTTQSQAMLSHFQAIARELGFPLKWTATGGGSDGNITAACGVPTLDGLGPVGGGYHSNDEYLEVDSLAQRAALSALAICRIAQSFGLKAPPK